MAKKTLSPVVLPAGMVLTAELRQRIADEKPSALSLAALGLGFAAGDAVAQAKEALANLIAPLSGKTDQASVDAYRAAADWWKAGYMQAHPDSPRNSANAAWSRLVQDLCEDAEDGTPAVFVRPQTAEMKKAAEKKAKQREADKAEKARQVKAGEDAILRLEKLTKQAQAAGAVAAPVQGAAAGKAARVMLELDPLEVHLIKMLRAGKASEAAKLVGELTAKPTAKAK